MLDMLDAAGVQYLLHALASEVVGAPAVEGVVFESKSGPLLIRAGCVVDCTGDGALAAAGAPYEIGRTADGLPRHLPRQVETAAVQRELLRQGADLLGIQP